MDFPMDQGRQFELASTNTKRIGDVVPGQRWVVMEGCFTPDDLRRMIDKIEGCNDNTERRID